MNVTGVLGIDSHLGYQLTGRRNDPSHRITGFNDLTDGFRGKLLDNPIRGSANQKSFGAVRELDQLLLGFRQTAFGFYDGVSRRSQLAFEIRDLAFGTLQYIFCLKPAFTGAEA